MLDTYIVVDCETTGLNPKTEKLVEIGAVKIENGRVTESFETLINPGKQMDERVVELTGITNEELKKAPAIEEILPSFVTFCKDYPLVGHNLGFDHSFLKKACVNLDLPFEKDGVDTLRISRVCLAELPSKKLGDLCEYYQIPLKPHRALADAEATALLLEKLKEQFAKEDASDKILDLFTPKRLVYQVKKQSKASKQQKERILLFAAQKKIVLDFDVEQLTRNEASRQYDLLIARYGRLEMAKH